MQEWAQTVRKLSLLALGPEWREVKELDEEGEEEDNESPTTEDSTKKETRKGLLDYMRKSNFVRGLRSSLRQMVWRKKCATFDEAVQAAAEEEAVESSHREEEVLSCYKRDLPKLNTRGLAEEIVAALEIRDEKKKEKEASQTPGGGGPKDAKRGRRGGPQPIKHRREASPESENEYEDEEAEGNRYSPYREQNRYYRRPLSPARRDSHDRAAQRYGGQLPLPRQDTRPRYSQEWGRRDLRDGRDEGRRTQRNYDAPMVCFNCQQPGHFKRECPHPPARPQGNGYRRLH